MTTVWGSFNLWVRFFTSNCLEKVSRTPAGPRKGGQWRRAVGQAGNLCQLPQKPGQRFQEMDWR